MSASLKYALIVAGLLFLAYHFAGKVLLPTLFPEDHRLVNDFGPYYAASRLIMEGENPYRSTDGHHMMALTDREMSAWGMNRALIPAYVYPSFLAIALIPISSLPFPDARLVWDVASALSMLACVGLTFRLLRRKPGVDVPTLLVCGIFFGSMPTLESFTLGQVNYITLLLILASFAGHVHHRSFLGGGALALASLVKVSPALLLLFFLWRRDFRFLAGFLAACAAAAALMLSVAPSVDAAFLRDVLPAVGGRAPELNNKALAVWWRVLFTENPLATPLARLPGLPPVLFLVVLVLTVAALAMVFRRSGRPVETGGGERAAVQFFASCVGLLFVQPYVEIHHLVFAFPPAACVAVLLTAGRPRWFAVSSLVVAALLLNNRGENSYRWLGPHWYSVFLSTPQTWGLLILLVLLCLILLGRIPGLPVTGGGQKIA